MKRIELLERLNQVSPALSDNNLVPVLSHIWFTGEAVMAYNDQIAISVPFKTDFIGAVPGTTLLSLLKNSRAVDVELTPSDSELLVKAASARIKLGLLPPDSFLFEMPEPSGKGLLTNTQHLMDAMDACLRSVSTDTSVADQLGITIIPSAEHLDLYATNAATMTHARIKAKTDLKSRVVLPTAFCRQFLSMADTGKSPRLDITDEYCLFVTPKNEHLFGRLIDVEKPLDFDRVFNHHCPKGFSKQLVAIPSKLQLIIERAVIIADAATEQTKTQINVKEGRMRFVSKSGRGEVVDSMLVGEHPDISIKVDMKHLKNGYGHFDKMLMTEKCAIMASDVATYLVSGVGV